MGGSAALLATTALAVTAPAKREVGTVDATGPGGNVNCCERVGVVTPPAPAMGSGRERGVEDLELLICKALTHASLGTQRHHTRGSDQKNKCDEDSHTQQRNEFHVIAYGANIY